MSAAVGEHKTAASADQNIGEEAPGSESLKGYDSDVSSGGDEVDDKFEKQQYHIIESIEDLRHIRERLYTIMQNEGEAGHGKCSVIIEDAIQEKVKIIKRSKKTGTLAQNPKIHDYFRKLAEQWLIDGFADLEVEDSNSSKSPLHYAAELGSKILVDALLLPFRFCRYRMANVSNSRGQTAIFPLLLNLDMSNKGSNSPHSDLNDVDVERRRKLLIRLIQVGLSFSHADNDNKSVLHYMREYQLHNRKSKKYDQYENLVKAGNAESNNSVEIKFVLKSLSALFIRDGKTALRKQSVAISKSKYNSFFRKLNGIHPTDDSKYKSDQDPKISQTIDNFSNCTYIYKCFPRVDYGSEAAEDIVSRVEAQSGSDHIYRRDTMTMANKETFSRSSRSEKNLCHVLFSDGSSPKYNLYFPLTVGKILFFSLKNHEKIATMQQPLFPIACGNKEIEHVCNMTMKGLESMWSNYDPCKRLAESENCIVKISDADVKSVRGWDVPKTNVEHSGEVKSPNRTRSLSFEEEDKAKKVSVTYIRTHEVLRKELDFLEEIDVNSLIRHCKSRGLVDADFEMVESLYKLAVEYSADIEKPDKRMFFTTLLLCKHLGFAPVDTFFSFYANYLETEMESDSMSDDDEDNRKKLEAFDSFRDTVYNQWARSRCMIIDFFDANSPNPINRQMPNSRYAYQCWGIKTKDVLECRKFCTLSKYAAHWRVLNLKIESDGVALGDSYIKTRRLIELYGMLRIIHGKYILDSIEKEFKLFLACSRFEGLCKAIDTLVPHSGSAVNKDKFDIKRLEKVLDKISVEYVGYLSVVRERRKILDAEFYEGRYQRFVSKIKKVFKQKEDATAAIAKLERNFDENFGVAYAMEKFELLCFQRYASGPHSIHLEFKNENGDVDSIVKRRSGMWRAQKLYENEIQSKETETARMRQSRSNTAAYFLREVVRTALEAGCGNEVCSCVNEIGCNLLEIIEAAPNLSEFLGKESQPTLSLIYQNLLLAASKYANEKKATRLIETLIAKKVNVLKLARDPTSNPLNYAADRRMLRASSVLIKAGATVTVNALEALFNALEGQEYYEKRVELETPSSEESGKTSVRESFNRTKSSRKSHGLKRTLSKQQIDSLFKQNGENVKSILRKQVLFHGAESGTLTSSIVHYMIEDSMTKARNDFDVCDTDEYGATAMHYASMNGHHRTILVLAECGGRNCMNRRDDNIHRTYGGQVFYKPLPRDSNDYLTGDVFAESTYRRRTITSYHEKYKGYTPLALAVQNGHVECVRVLLDLGADPFLRDINKTLPNPHLVDPTCPYWLTLGIRLPSLPVEVIENEDEVKQKQNNFLYVCALNQRTVRRPKIPTVQGFDSVFQRSHGRRSVMNAHFKGQLDSILLVEQRRRSRRKMYKKFIRQWYDAVLRDGVRSIVDRRLEHQERTMVNYGKSEGVRHIEATFAKQLTTEDGVTSLITGTSYMTLQKRREGINLLMRKHPAVHLMRTRYGTYRFYIYLIYYMSSLFFPMVFCIFLLNAGEGVNQMRERIENELGKPSGQFHTIDYDKNNFYNWLENGLLKKVIPTLETEAYTQVGKPQLEIRRLRDYDRRWNSSDHIYQDYQEPSTTIDAALIVKNFSNSGWGGPSLQASFNCAKNNSCLFNFQEDKLIFKLNIEEDFANQSKFLKENNFLDKYSYSVRTKFIFYSFSTGSYCQTTVGVKYMPSKLAVTDITYYVFTTNLNFRRGKDEFYIRFHHVCLFCFVLIIINEIWALFRTYYWSCRGPCLRVKVDYERRRRGDMFWDKELHENDEEDGGVAFGRGRGISVVNVRLPRKKSNGSIETPWERKMNRARRKSEAKIRKELRELRQERIKRQPSSARRSATPQFGTPNPVEGSRKKLRRAQTSSERTSTTDTSDFGIMLNKVKIEEGGTWASDRNNVRTQVREHMQELLSKATTNIVSTHRDNQKFHYSARDILQLWFLRLKIAYENKQILDLLYVSAGFVLISNIFYFMIAVQDFETKMKSSDNSKYVDEIDEAVGINQSLRLLFIVFTVALFTKIARFAKVHPVFGKFILAIAKVIVSNSITHFLVLYMLFYFISILCYHVMFGDVVIDFADFLRTAMTLVRLGITGEHEEGTMMPTTSPYMDLDGKSYLPRFLLVVFMLLSVLFAMNLFIAIITAEWSKYVDADLWGSEIDNELRLHVEYNHAGLIFDRNPVLGWLIQIWRDQHIEVCGKKRIRINCFKTKLNRRFAIDEIDVSENSINENGNSSINRKSRMSRLRAISYST